MLVSSLAAERLAKRHPQRTLIIAGFVTTIAGVAVLLALVEGSPSRVGVRAGAAAHRPRGRHDAHARRSTSSNRPSPRTLQGEISGLSRCISNLGSSLGTAIAGTILVAGLTDPKKSYALAMIVLAVAGLIGLVAAMILPSQPMPQATARQASDTAAV